MATGQRGGWDGQQDVVLCTKTCGAPYFSPDSGSQEPGTAMSLLFLLCRKHLILIMMFPGDSKNHEGFFLSAWS
jgi:hypothetical protein